MPRRRIAFSSRAPPARRDVFAGAPESLREGNHEIVSWSPSVIEGAAGRQGRRCRRLSTEGREGSPAAHDPAGCGRRLSRRAARQPVLRELLSGPPPARHRGRVPGARGDDPGRPRVESPEERVPGQHEPRAADAHERGHGDDRAAVDDEARREAAPVRRRRAHVGQLAPHDPQRDPRFLEDRSGQDGRPPGRVQPAADRRGGRRAPVGAGAQPRASSSRCTSGRTSPRS